MLYMACTLYIRFYRRPLAIPTTTISFFFILLGHALCVLCACGGCTNDLLIGTWFAILLVYSKVYLNRQQHIHSADYISGRRAQYPESGIRIINGGAENLPQRGCTTHSVRCNTCSVLGTPYSVLCTSPSLSCSSSCKIPHIRHHLHLYRASPTTASEPPRIGGVDSTTNPSYPRTSVTGLVISTKRHCLRVLLTNGYKARTQSPRTTLVNS